ncbi:NUDIX hydrolase [Planococcus sp. YIM B11945]|uniref:NUDIX hydrolase n=1 Tax=Planococcus sp. YIM B11945 TaxID=3435410 RepID=UPI003D7E2AF2
METEQIAYCSEEGQPLGVAAREEVHKRGLWHETFHCWIVSKRDGRDVIHLQLRSAEKKDFPDLLDITAAGHLLAGETVEDGIREVEEELGIAVAYSSLIPLGVIKDQIRHKDFIDNERCNVFLYQAPPNVEERYMLQQEEVAGMVEVEFEAFYSWCFGEQDELEVCGMGRLLNKTVTLKDLVPHSEAYWQNVAQAIKQEMV